MGKERLLPYSMRHLRCRAMRMVPGELYFSDLVHSLRMIDTIVTAPGSLGDVNPLIAIARGLQQSGRQVVFVAAERYLPLAAKAGLATRALMPEDVFAKVVDNPDLWHARKGLKVVLGPAGQGFMEEHYTWLGTQYQPGKTLLVSHILDFAGRVFRDAHPEVAYCCVVPAPALLRSLNKPPRLSRSGIETHLPKFLLALGYRHADRIIDGLIAPAVNRLRVSVGLPPVQRVLDRWWASPDLTLGLFPDWFSIPAIDLPPGMRCVGFPLADSGDLLPDAAEHLVGQALAPLAGERPIVFAPGSAHAHARRFLTAAAEACGNCKLPGVLLSSVESQFPTRLPPNVVTAKYLPFRELLKSARAIVHHGGIGTTSQSLAAGLPQVVVPMAFDQFDNAARVKRLGCGRWLPMVSVSAKRLERQLTRVLGDADVQTATTKVAAMFERATPEQLAKVILDHFRLTRELPSAPTGGGTGGRETTGACSTSPVITDGSSQIS